MENSIKTYQPDNSIKKGYLSVFSEIIAEIKDNRWLTVQLFKRDFFALYKQSFIGVLWIFIIPVCSVATFMVLNRSGVLSVGRIDAPYPIFAVLGVAFWQFFSSGLIAASGSLVDAGAMIKIINFSKKSLVIAATGRAVVSFLVQILFVAFLFFYFKWTPHTGILWTPVMMLPLLFLTMGLGFIFSLLNGVMRDIANALSLLMTFLMFLTPVLYAKPSSGLLAKITHYNPLYYLINGPRDMILNGFIAEPKGFIWSAVFSVFLFAFSVIVFHLTETRITERV